MLSLIRKNATGLGMTLLMGLLVITFSFWGVQNYLTGSNNDAVATVNGKKISVDEYNRKFAQYRQRLMNQLGENFDPAQLDNPTVRRQFLENMIESEVLRQQAGQGGFIVTPQQLRDAIQQAPIFQIDGQFSKEAYANFLRNRGQSARAFEQTLSDEMTAGAIADLVSASAFATDKEARQAWKLAKQTRDFAYLVLSPQQFSADYEPEAAEIEAYYNEFGDQFMQPEQVNVEYIELSLDDLARQMPVSEDEIRQVYEERKNNPVAAEKRQAAHILITPENDSPEADKKALEKAQALYQQLKNGADFTELAKAESQDPGSAAQGGDLGMVAQGVMVPEFDQALFSMGYDQISEPVKTKFGYHIIKTAPYPAYEDIKNELAQELRLDKADEAFLNKANELETQVLESYDSLDEAAEKAGLTIKQTGYFDRASATGIAAHPNFQNAAFSTEVLEDGRNSDVIDLGDNHIAFVKLLGHKPAARKSLDEVRDTIVTALKAQKGQQLALAAGEQMAAAVSAGQPLTELAKEKGYELKQATQVSRSDASVPRELLMKTFALPKPAEGTVVRAIPLSQGQVAVVVLKGVHNADTAKMNEDELKAMKLQIQRNAARNDLQAVLEQLKNDADIVVFEDKFNQQ